MTDEERIAREMPETTSRKVWANVYGASGVVVHPTLEIANREAASGRTDCIEGVQVILPGVRPMTDKERLDYLEQEIRREPLLLHNTTGINAPEWKGFRGRGLSLLPPDGRTLREAIDQMAGERVAAIRRITESAR